ncbi:MAG: protein-disulfide reductase DsbD domain-containing protein [Hyphomicrobiaceae bacterium]
MVKTAAGWLLASCGLLSAGSLALGLPVGSVRAEDAAAPPLASAWSQEQSSRVRLIAGSVMPAGETSRKIYAGVEIDLEAGWKTYWRNPGSSGVPPRVDTEGSENLAKAELLFPAPARFRDRDGDTIGYKKHVVLPVALTPKDPTKPIVLKVSAEFGICREVCIPVQPVIGLTVPPDAAEVPAKGPLQAALDRVPRAGTPDAGAPRLQHVAARLSGDKPQVVIDVQFPGKQDDGDVFLEAPDGIWIPLPKPAGQSENGGRRFVVDLTDGADIADLKGRRIRVTLVGTSGQSEAAFDMVDTN